MWRRHRPQELAEGRSEPVYTCGHFDDRRAVGGSSEYLCVGVQSLGLDIPVFSITFGDADPSQLQQLAELTGGRVFDGTEDLTEAFRSVKGYN